MKLEEVNTPKPIVYLDMDGVLADFFASWAQLAGIKSGNYKDIPPADIDPTLNKMIGTDFFARLPKFSTADKLIQLVINRFGSYSICSSPLRNDHENSKKHKIDWIGRKLKIKPVETIIVANKVSYAKQPDGTPNILIDDRGKNIEGWNNAGGYGIKYQADEDSLEKVIKGLDDYQQKLGERGVMGIGGIQYGGFRRPLKIKKSTPGKLHYTKPKGKKIKMGTDGNMSYKKFVKKVYEDGEPSVNENEDLDTKEFKDILNPALEKLDSVFKKNNFEIRIVGGAVRDIALGKSPKDIDLATDATPDEMIAMLGKAGIKHKPTGLEHGTLTAIIDGEGYEITTLRADVSTDGRHADVEFIRNWKEDAQRRDLTYNAMSVDFDGNLYDYFNGMDDLQDRVSKFVGEPVERIKEDYLRILRYFRFQSKLESPTWDKETLNAIKDHAKGLTQVSVERIWQEMAKLLVGPSVIQTLSYMSATDVDDVIGLQTSKIQMLNDLKGNNDPVIALSILVDDTALANKWKLSNAEAQDLKFYLSYRDKKLNKEQAEHLVIDGKDKSKIINLLKIQNQDELANYIEQFQIPEFPITGNDLIQHGMTPGPGLGNTLNKLKDMWKKSNYDLSADDLLKAVTTESKSFAIKRMKDMLNIDEGVGIITPYNTTKDVKPGETARQANKLGLRLKRKGKGEGMPELLMRSWQNEKRGSTK